MLQNKLGITDNYELMRQEELISKKKASELFEKGIIDTFGTGSFKGLSHIHKFLFEDIYLFAGEVRTVNIAKGNFRFASIMYLESALSQIEKNAAEHF